MNPKKSQYLLICLLSLFLFSGCEKAAETNNEAYPQNNYTITLQEGQLTINGHTLPLPMPANNVIERIGVNSRFANQANDIYTWDDHGFILWSRPHRKSIFQIGVYVRKKPMADYLNYVEGYIDSRPKQDFSGILNLDGVIVTKNITFETINAKKTGTKFRRTHWDDKFKYSAKVPSTGQWYHVIIYLNQNRTIEYVEIAYDELPAKSGLNDSNKISATENTSKSDALYELQKQERREAMWSDYKEEYSFTDTQLTEFKKQYVEYEKQEKNRLNAFANELTRRLKSGEITQNQFDFEVFKYLLEITDENFERYSKASDEIENTKDERNNNDTHSLNMAADASLLKNFGAQRAKDIETIARRVKNDY